MIYKKTLYPLGHLISSFVQVTAGVKGKGRAVAKPLPPPGSDLDDDEIVPDSELEFEDLEDVIQIESSDDSGDDFVPGESSQSDVPQDRESDVPLRVSMATPSTPVRPSSSKAGPSSKTSRRPISAAKTQSEMESSDSSDSDDSILISKKTPRRRQVTPARSRGKRGAVQTRRPPGPRRKRGRRAESDQSDQEFDISDGFLESSDDDASPPSKGLDPHQIRALIKVAERRMRKKLGRKLTVVRPSSPALNRPGLTIVCFQRDKATAQLQLFHPELKSCWGDLKKSIAIVTPEKAEQPKNLRVTLLPFQQEGLHWMKKQECGAWSGGILAVSVFVTIMRCASLPLRLKDEMGMGKTIQMISLLVSDQERPNLVIA